jgi:hypothetical protein
MKCESIKQFRQEIYETLGKGKDAVFELMDAVLLSKKVSSFAELSLSPVFRRKWPSIYEGLEDNRPRPKRQRELLINQIPSCERILLAGDHTAWGRRESKTLKDRTYEHGGKVISGKPITVGHGYSTIAWIPEEKGSWALPLCHQRITSFENPLRRAAFQLKQICQHLRQRPLSLWDSEYGCAKFVEQTADIAADKILRLRPNLCLWQAPPTYSGKGRPKEHGDKFKLSDTTTWTDAIESQEIDDPVWGTIELTRWSQLHFRQSAQIEMELILIQRKGDSLKSDPLKPIWLAALLETPLPLEQYWSLYQKRFAIEHWYRFAKQRLHWTVPHFQSLHSSERWSDLMPLLTWQLWLAREIVEDDPFPWQKPQSSGSLTPGRVAQSMGGVLAVIGTPTSFPKPRGKSLGWPQGQPRSRKIRFPIVKKRFSPKKKKTTDSS